MTFAFDMDLIFMALTLGCVVFVLQTLVDYNRQSSAMRPQLKEVARIKAQHREEIEKLEQSMEEADAKSEQLSEEVSELEARRKELETLAAELRDKLNPSGEGESALPRLPS